MLMHYEVCAFAKYPQPFFTSVHTPACGDADVFHRSDSRGANRKSRDIKLHRAQARVKLHQIMSCSHWRGTLQGPAFMSPDQQTHC